jgi:hypothetical protein
MSLAQILDHLRTGNIIIVPGNAAAPRLRLPATLARWDAIDGNSIQPRKLLRNLIAVRRDGAKKK